MVRLGGVYVNTAGVSAHTSTTISNKQRRTALTLENKTTESDSAQNIVSSAFPGPAREAAFFRLDKQIKKKK
jgi:hypothetical protein